MSTTHPRLSPTVDRHLAARFAEPFLFSLLAFAGVYLLADFFDRFNDLMRHNGLSWLGLEYFLLKLPLIFSQIMPVACLAGALLATATLNRSGEILAFQGLGVSRLAIAAPFLAIGAIVSVADFGLAETLVPIATRHARYVYEVEIKHRHLKGVFASKNIWIRTRNGFVSADHYDARKLTLEGVTIFRIEPATFRLRWIEQIPKAWWDGRGWRVDRLSHLTLRESGSVEPGKISSDRLNLGAKPDDLNLLRRDPEEFSLAELNRYVHSLRRKGIDPGGYLVDRDLKLAMPFACLIMVALALAFSLDPRPRAATLSRSFGLGVGIGFTYWIVLGFTASFGRSALIPPWLAAWAPNLLFSALAAALFLLGEER